MNYKLLILLILLFIITSVIIIHKIYIKHSVKMKNFYLQPIESITLNNYIPKKVYMTYYDLKKIPQYVKDNIYKYCSGYDIEIYDDKMCIDFFKKFYNNKFVDIFCNLKIGAHKADFWRYCILYIFGGFYFDIKINFITHIDNIFNINSNSTWYTVLDNSNERIFNGIIVTPKHNPILYNNIKYIYKNSKSKNYNSYIIYMYKSIKKETINNKIIIGKNNLKNNSTLILYNEICSKCNKNKNNKECDRYNYKCIIENEKKKHIFNTRYNDFPWK